jgi:hypothetical protein
VKPAGVAECGTGTFMIRGKEKKNKKIGTDILNEYEKWHLSMPRAEIEEGKVLANSEIQRK